MAPLIYELPHPLQTQGMVTKERRRMIVLRTMEWMKVCLVSYCYLKYVVTL